MICHWCGVEFPKRKGIYCGTCQPPDSMHSRLVAMTAERDALLRENERYSEQVRWQEERANKAEAERDNWRWKYENAAEQAARIRADEREACAKVPEDNMLGTNAYDDKSDRMYDFACKEIARAIRGREGEK